MEPMEGFNREDEQQDWNFILYNTVEVISWKMNLEEHTRPRVARQEFVTVLEA